jgi:CheY-like chemotaxis protein
VKSLRILVVDDSEDSADMLATLLRLTGHEARAVYGGAEALELAAAATPDAIFLDIGLPGIDGYELVRRLRARPGAGDILVVATTGFSDVNDRRRAKEAGFDAFLVKPIDPLEVERILKNVDD